MKFLRSLSTSSPPPTHTPLTPANVPKVNGQARRFFFFFLFCCRYEDSGLERSQCISSPNFCCLCLFHFPHRLVLCCFMYVSLVVSSMWFLCLSASYLFVSSLALLLFSLPFSPSTSCYLSPSLTPSLNLFLFLYPPSVSLPPSLPPSRSLSFPISPYLPSLPPVQPPPPSAPLSLYLSHSRSTPSR